MTIKLDKLGNGKEKSDENTGEKKRTEITEKNFYSCNRIIQPKWNKNQYKTVWGKEHLERLNLFPKRD
jgi:hypothetical protein